MKLLFPTALLSILAINALFSQNWLNDNDKWVYSYLQPPYKGYQTVEVIGDTLINDKACKILASQQIYVSYIPFHNQDTFYSEPVYDFLYESGDSVFYLFENQFQLIYNFNLESGDTLRIPKAEEWCQEDVVMIIDSVKTIFIGEEERKVQYVTLPRSEINLITHQKIQIIEGLGIVEGRFIYENGNETEYNLHGHLIPYVTYSCYYDTGSYAFLCFESDRFDYQPFDLDCYHLPMIVSTEEIVQSGINLVPNPVVDELKIVVERSNFIEKIEIFSLDGKLLMQITPPSTIINLRALAKGIYIINVQTREKNYIQKIVKN